MGSDAERAWQHPWLRIQLLLRSMLGTRWDAKTWPTIKAEMKKALEMRTGFSERHRQDQARAYWHRQLVPKE